MCKETRVSPEIVGINHFSIQFKRHRMLLLPDMGGVRRRARRRGGGLGRRRRLPHSRHTVLFSLKYFSFSLFQSFFRWARPDHIQYPFYKYLPFKLTARKIFFKSNAIILNYSLKVTQRYLRVIDNSFVSFFFAFE